MAGQLWGTDSLGGFMYSDSLSRYLRTQLQPQTRFRQFCEPEDGTDKGLNKGELLTWNIYSNVARQGRRIAEGEKMPETNFSISQGELRLVELGNSVPYTGLLESLAEHKVKAIINKTLMEDARKAFDIEAFLQFKSTYLKIAPAGGTDTEALTVTTNGTAGETNNVALGADHMKSTSDEMRERNIPPYVGDDYMSISHPSTYRPFRNELETLMQYTTSGMDKIYNGEIGRYEGFRFVTQTFIPKGGAADSTNFNTSNVYSGTADAWNNAKSSWAFFFGKDTVVEGYAIPEEVRGKLPGDYGRDKGMAWYYLGGFAIVHRNSSDTAQTRIAMWDSAA